jgi:hypothetical protein
MDKLIALLNTEKDRTEQYTWELEGAVGIVGDDFGEDPVTHETPPLRTLTGLTFPPKTQAELELVVYISGNVTKIQEVPGYTAIDPQEDLGWMGATFYSHFLVHSDVNGSISLTEIGSVVTSGPNNDQFYTGWLAYVQAVGDVLKVACRTEQGTVPPRMFVTARVRRDT